MTRMTANHAHGATTDAHGHGTHVDPSGDKRAAFMGLFAGMVLLGGFLYGMVTWTNARYAGHEGGGPAAAQATH